MLRLGLSQRYKVLNINIWQLTMTLLYVIVYLF